MKRLKFLIVALGVFAAQGVFAVTLPTTSYNEYSSYVTTEDYSAGGVALPSTSFMQLSAISYDECTAMATFQACEQCCKQMAIDCYNDTSIPDKSECNTLSTDCNNGCGRSLPLDAPLWFLLVGAVILSVAKTLTIYVRHSKQS